MKSLFVILCMALILFSASRSSYAGSNDTEWDKLWAEAGPLEHHHKFEQASDAIKKAAQLAEAALGPNNIEVYKQSQRLAGLYARQGLYVQAVLWYERALAIMDKQSRSSEDYEKKPYELYELAEVYVEKGDYSLAEKTYKLNYDAEYDGNKLLANLYKAQGNYKKALPLYNQNLERFLKEDPDSNRVCSILMSIAEIYMAQGDFPRAENFYDQAISKNNIFNKRLGIGFDWVPAKILSARASMFEKRGLYKKADELYEKALESIVSYDTVARVESPTHAEILRCIARRFKAKGQYGEAETAYKQSISILEYYYGLNHPEVASVLGDYADLYFIQGKYKQAEPILNRSLAIRKTSFGDKHPSVATSLDGLAQLYRKTKRTKEAKKLEKQASVIRAALTKM